MDRERLAEPGDLAAMGLSEKEVARATAIARRFDPRPHHAILQFGAALQKRVADLAASACARVRVSDAGLVGDVTATDMTLRVEGLRRMRQALLCDMVRFELLREEAAANLVELLVYLHAAEIKLADLRTRLGASERHATDESDLLANMVRALEHRRHDLKLTAMLAQQTAMQARVLWFNGQTLIKTIQNSIQCAQVWHMA